MASEQVRLASEVLGPLLRKRGTSPALGASLRRAVQALDQALVEDDESVSVESANRAAKELQGCLPLIRDSKKPADHAQLDGITKVLSFLIPAGGMPVPPVVVASAPVQATLKMVLPAPEPLPAPPAEPEPAPAPPVLLTPLPLPTPLAPPSSVPPAAPATPESTKPEPQASPTRAPLQFPTVRLRVEGLQDCLRLLCVVSKNHLAALADFETAHAKMRRAAQAVKWLGTSRVLPFRELAGETPNSGKQVAADLALCHLGDRQSVEQLLGVLEKVALTPKQWLPPYLAETLHVLAATDSLDILLAFFRNTSSPKMRALLLPALAEHDALPAGQLLDLALDGDDEVAARAAEALAWTADAAEASLLFTWAMGAKTPLRSSALLFSAIALGSAPALVEARKRLVKPTMFVGYLVDALAIAGDDSDVAGLLDLAVTTNPDTTHILLAAAGMGNAKMLFEFDDFDRHAPAAVLDEVPWMVLGKSGLPPRPRLLPREKATRMLRGRPWSVSAVLDRLCAPDELLLFANRMALELRVRTGIMPPCRLPLFASAATRSDILAQWRAHYAKADAKLKPGDWYFQGKEGIE